MSLHNLRHWLWELARWWTSWFPMYLKVTALDNMWFSEVICKNQKSQFQIQYNTMLSNLGNTWQYILYFLLFFAPFSTKSMRSTFPYTYHIEFPMLACHRRSFPVKLIKLSESIARWTVCCAFWFHKFLANSWPGSLPKLYYTQQTTGWSIATTSSLTLCALWNVRCRFFENSGSLRTQHNCTR